MVYGDSRRSTPFRSCSAPSAAEQAAPSPSSAGFPERRPTSGTSLPTPCMETGHRLAPQVSAYFPYVGDAAKTSKVITKFVAKHPDQVRSLVKSLAGVGQDSGILARQVSRDQRSQSVDALRTYDVSDDKIVQLARRGTALAILVQTLDRVGGKVVQAYPAPTPTTTDSQRRRSRPQMHFAHTRPRSTTQTKSRMTPYMSALLLARPEPAAACSMLARHVYPRPRRARRSCASPSWRLSPTPRRCSPRSTRTPFFVSRAT